MEKNENIVTNANKSGYEKRNVPTLRFKAFAAPWEQKTFDEIFWMLTNNTLSRAELNYNGGVCKNVHYGDVLIRFPAHIDISSSDVPYINDQSFNLKLNCSLLQSGDIVIADTAEDLTVGKATEIENKKNMKVSAGLHTIPCRPKIKFSPRYLGYYINSPAYHDQLIPFIQGIKVSSISKTLIRKTFISFPSIFEQSKIATFLSCLDKKIEVQNKIISKYETLIKGLCDRVFRHNKSIRLSDLVKCRTSTLQESDIVKYCDGEYKVFGASGVIATVDKYQFDRSGILVLKDGSNAGKVQFASGKYSVIGTSVVLIPNDVNDAKFLYFALLAVDFDKYKVGSGIPHIYFKDYSNEQIYYPEATLREKINKTLSCYETKVETEKEMLSALQKQKTFLLQSMFI